MAELVRAQLFTGHELASLAGDILGSTRTGKGGVAVTYKERTGTPTRNFSTGAEAPAETEHAVNAIYFDERDDQGLGQETGGIVFLVAASELSIDPSAADVIVDADSREYYVERAELDPTGTVWIIETREEGTK